MRYGRRGSVRRGRVGRRRGVGRARVARRSTMNVRRAGVGGYRL